MILAGDIGGTKCNLALLREAETGALEPVFQYRYATRDFSDSKILSKISAVRQQNAPVVSRPNGLPR